jgi:Phosphotriesterase family
LTDTEIIRSIRCDIAPTDLGPCDAHEHLFLVTPAQPGDEYSDVAKAIEEAEMLRAAGARALVDWTPIGLGRDLDRLRAVSEATGLHIVAATGLHRDVHYSADDPVRSESEDALADRFVADLEVAGSSRSAPATTRSRPSRRRGSPPPPQHMVASVRRSASTPSMGRWGSPSSSGYGSWACRPSA